MEFEQIITNIFVWFSQHWLGVGVVLSYVIQVSPIKINPWSAAFKALGSAINADLKEELADTKAQVKECMAAIDENEKDRIRHEMFSFAESCRRGIQHTKGDFERIIKLNSKYEALLEKTNDNNGVFTEEYNYILEIYHEHQHEKYFQ